MSDKADPTSSFDDVRRVIADPLRFKLRLGIGEDAYTSLKLKKRVQDLWDVGGVAATGGTVVASKAVASTFFASTASGGILSVIGLGTAAATPIGWIVGAAVVSGGAYYGVTQLFKGYAGSRVDVVPKFINTPIDVLGVRLFDLMGSLSVRLAAIDGRIDDRERQVVVRHFTTDWGFDPGYIEQALRVLEAGAEAQGLQNIARELSAFLIANPDCNPPIMHVQLMTLLRDVAEADGVFDEREELAMARIDAIIREEVEFSLQKAGRSIASFGSRVGDALRGIGSRWARGQV